MGDALLQKTYTVDFLTKKRAQNNGHAAQYYVEDSHEGIISKEEFAAVQAEFERRGNMRGYSKTGRSKFRRSKWGKGKNQQVVWICINHQMSGGCAMKAVKEKAVEQAFLRVMNRLISSKGTLIPQWTEKKEEEYTLREPQVRIEELQAKMMSLAKLGFDEKEYSSLAGEIDLLRKQMRGG